jgi:HSP20 family molecular chaperone IbpA
VVGTPAEERSAAAYPVNIREEDGKLVVDAEMPGFKRDEIDVDIQNGVLRISAERRDEAKKGTPYLSERCYRRVDRSFTLPVAVDESKVDAKLQEGVLHLEMPQTEESKPKRIEVK